MSYTEFCNAVELTILQLIMLSGDKYCKQCISQNHFEMFKTHKDNITDNKRAGIGEVVSITDRIVRYASSRVRRISHQRLPK